MRWHRLADNLLALDDLRSLASGGDNLLGLNLGLLLRDHLGLLLGELIMLGGLGLVIGRDTLDWDLVLLSSLILLN